MKKKSGSRSFLLGTGIFLFSCAIASSSHAQPVPGGTLDPLTIPKYVTPLVIPPVMPTSSVQPGTPAADYNLAVREFYQQILPGGIWDTVADPTDMYPNFPATKVWGYGPDSDPFPDSSGLGGGMGVAPASNSHFNYPAYTVETVSHLPNTVRWINDLVDPATGNYLPHLFAVDQTLHWANPPAVGCADGTDRTDCRTLDPTPYEGPVPMVTHVHGAHVNQESDGYPEAWWLPAANNIPAGYATGGTLFDQYDRSNTVPGSAYYGYENDQPATTLWYHDHTLGMTRLNVYAGPAGFWLIRGGLNGDDYVDDALTPMLDDGTLPGPAPQAGEGVLSLNLPSDPVRRKTREIPVVIQDRSFNEDGSLFYPDNRAFFQDLPVEQLLIPFIPDSDISPIWNPEAFFNTMVVNGVSWPQLEVAPDRYRFRLLDGCNSRFLNLSLFVVTGPGTDGVMGTADDTLGQELPFYQIGAEQGFLPQVVMIQTGFATPLPGDGSIPALLPQDDPQAALLLGPAERADVIVDFSGLADGTIVRLINTAPDAPFGGFPDTPADPDTTGQVMQFTVNSSLLCTADECTDGATTPPERLALPAEVSLGPASKIRQLSLNEEVSHQLCVNVAPDGTITPALVLPAPEETLICPEGSVPFGPKAALLGVIEPNPATGLLGSTTLLWMDSITENPVLGDTEEWQIYNLTEDAHPIHLHLVRFEVSGRQALDVDHLAPAGPLVDAQPWETGYKDTVIAYPGQITSLKARFDRAGLYVWHCHIVEHEDNEMMRPYVVRFRDDLNDDGCVDRYDANLLLQVVRSPDQASLANLRYDLNGDGAVTIADVRYLTTKFTNPYGASCP